MTSRTAPLTTATLREGVSALARQDEELRGIVQQFGVPPMWGRRPGFATLVRIILEQQVSLAAAKTMFERVQRAAGVVTPEHIDRLGIAGLRALGLTGQKSSFCYGLAQDIRRGTLNLRDVARAPDDEGRALLRQVRGLGPWSVDIYFLMALRRPDVWPHGDLALADAVFRIKQLPARPDYRTLTAYAERWAPWRAVAARILWHHYLSVRVPGARAHAAAENPKLPGTRSNERTC